MKKYILSLDQGTTSSRAIVFNEDSRICGLSQKEFTQIFPKPGWVEHDPMEILETQLSAARDAIRRARAKKEEIIGIGIANQRETTVMWDKKTGKPVHNAIVWQCRRTADLCAKLKKAGLEKEIRRKTGLLLDPYFSGTKVKWLLENVPGLKARAAKGDVVFGTIDTWLLYNLTGEHKTDPSNASRTLLFNINSGKWDESILRELGIPKAILPEVVPSVGVFGTTKKEILGVSVPVAGIAGDQQAALFGQCCFSRGEAKNTYGTGCFALLNTGKEPVFSKNNLLSTVAWDIGKGLEYALEGSVFIAGAVVQWLRDELGIIHSAPQIETLARSVDDSAGVYFVPAFVGLGAPHWNPEARGTLFGITRGTKAAHIARAALESIAFQCRDLFAAMEKDMKKKISTVKVDGGASTNDFLMQFQSDILGIPIKRPEIPETTALGAAYFAGLATGVWSGLPELSKKWRMDSAFAPKMDAATRTSRIGVWDKAVEATLSFV
jgi:glycerol kinase